MVVSDHSHAEFKTAPLDGVKCSIQLTLSIQARLASLILRDLVYSVLLAVLVLAECPFCLRYVHLQGGVLKCSAKSESDALTNHGMELFVRSEVIMMPQSLFSNCIA